MSTAGLVFLIITILSIVVPGIISIAKRDGTVMVFSLFALAPFLVFSLIHWPGPTNGDVRDGKAIYVTEEHVGVGQEGDTIYNYNTYHLEWLPEWKYGRWHETEKTK